MVPSARSEYNRHFHADAYAGFLRDIQTGHPGAIAFRVAETPLFVPRDLARQMREACEGIIDVILQPGFRQQTDRAIPRRLHVPGEPGHCEFMVFDFAVTRDASGTLAPRLVELQGVPSMNAFQGVLAANYRKHFRVPEGFSAYPGRFDEDGFNRLLRDTVVGDQDPAEVILLDVQPQQQKTRIDFYLTEDMLGVRPVCITELRRSGRSLYYRRDGRQVPVKRIYNRLIFDDLLSQKKTLGRTVDLTRHLDVTWAAHPHWFYRISKFTLPLLSSPYVPATYYLDKLAVIPANLDDYVLKPLFSFAGQGVLVDVTQEDLDHVRDPREWILQQKIAYAPVVETPEGPAKCEIRMMYFWPSGAARPLLAHSLCRLSKGKMVGVRYNADRSWVGASACFFQEE